jgi:Uma2 family endonuclease
MATVLDPPVGELVNLRVSWETYKRLLADYENDSSVRFTFDQGWLEILVKSSEHEAVTGKAEQLIALIAEEMEFDFECTRCTTFLREDLKKGFEGDSSYYFQNASRVRGAKRLDLTNDPPPELIIETDVTNSSMNKFLIFAAVGVREIWVHSGGEFSIFTLKDKHYVKQLESSVLPKAAASKLTEFVQSSFELDRPTWVKRVRAWARSL